VHELLTAALAAKQHEVEQKKKEAEDRRAARAREEQLRKQEVREVDREEGVRGGVGEWPGPTFVCVVWLA
jgi:hypothetical protein